MGVGDLGWKSRWISATGIIEVTNDGMPAGYDTVLTRLFDALDVAPEWIDWWEQTQLPRLGVFFFFDENNRGDRTSDVKKVRIRLVKKMVVVDVYAGSAGVRLDRSGNVRQVREDFTAVLDALRGRFKMEAPPDLPIGL